MIFHNRICKSIRKANSRRLLMSATGTFSTVPSETKVTPRRNFPESEVFEMQPLEHPISNQELRQKYLMESVQKILNSHPIDRSLRPSQSISPPISSIYPPMDRSLRPSPSISPPSPTVLVTNGHQYSPSTGDGNKFIFVETRRKR